MDSGGRPGFAAVSRVVRGKVNLADFAPSAYNINPDEWIKIASVVDRTEFDCRDRYKKELKQKNNRNQGIPSTFSLVVMHDPADGFQVTGPKKSAPSWWTSSKRSMRQWATTQRGTKRPGTSFARKWVAQGRPRSAGRSGEWSLSLGNDWTLTSGSAGRRSCMFSSRRGESLHDFSLRIEGCLSESRWISV
jgi:hypothetical protein